MDNIKLKQAWKKQRDCQARYLKEVHRSLLSQREDCEARQTPQVWLMLTLLVIGVILIVSHCNVAHAAVSDDIAVRCIIGEAENQGYDGMLAIGYAIHNRGSLRGVYGCRSVRVLAHLYDVDTYADAVSAWREVKEKWGHDITFGATGWGNNSDIRTFERHAWWNHCDVTVIIGDHTFYKCRRR